MEKAGGALALIIDSINEDVTDILLSDDGTGAGIRIPSMLINKKQGDMLKQHLLKANAEELKTTFLKADFQSSKDVNGAVRAELWYTSSDDRSLDFISNVAEYIVPIIERMSFEPKFVTWACPHCDSDYKRTNCVSDGKYCAMQHSEVIEMNGAMILRENLVEYCLFLKQKSSNTDYIKETKNLGHLAVQGKLDFYFAYMKLVHELCRNRIT